jgi:flagellar biosynthesis component FlhA
MSAPMLALLPLLDILDTLNDLSLVIKIMTFAYMLLWLYAQLRESPLLFGFGAMIVGFFLFVQPLPTIFIVILFVIFVSLGMHLQFLIQFGLYPLLRIFGVEMEHPEVGDQQKMQKITQKLQQGEELSHEEENWLEQTQKKDTEYQRRMQERMMRYTH